MAGANGIRCRQIGADDLAGIADLLARGFPLRPRAYWMRGLARLAARDVPEGAPRFGFMLEDAGRAVGAILTIAVTIAHEGEPFARWNLASWTVEPAYRSHAALLAAFPLRQKAASFLNVSAAPHTWPIIEAQGFRRTTGGQVLALPALGHRESGLRVAPFRASEPAHGPRFLPEAGLLADHAANGCFSLVGISPEGAHPFVFLPYRPRQGRWWFPGVQLIYCRSVAEVARFAAPLGRRLAAMGYLLMLVDADGPVSGLPGVFLKGRARKYAKGPHPPRIGDLAYTEFTIFGP